MDNLPLAFNKTATRREFLLSVGRFTFRHWLTSSFLLGTGGILAWRKRRATPPPAPADTHDR